MVRKGEGKNRERMDEDVMIKDMVRSRPGVKRLGATISDDPKIGIKKWGRIHLNRPAANALLGRTNYIQMMLSPETSRLYLKSSDDDLRSHKIAFGRGGVPAVIASKSALQSMGIDLSNDLPDLFVEVHEASQEYSNDRLQVKPGDVILIATVPKRFLKAAAGS